MKEQLSFKKLDTSYLNDMMVLIIQLNPNRDVKILKKLLEQMLNQETYYCFGLFIDDTLNGLIGCWTSIRLYTGKHLELDNVIINNELQSKGYGKSFFAFLENWAMKNEYDAIGLNTYIANDRSHKFYFNQGYKILGFNFQKLLTT